MEIEKVVPSHVDDPGRNANGARIPAEAVGVVEDEGSVGEPIEVGCDDVGVSQGLDRVKALVVGEDVEDVWGT